MTNSTYEPFLSTRSPNQAASLPAADELSGGAIAATCRIVEAAGQRYLGVTLGAPGLRTLMADQARRALADGKAVR